MRIHHLIAATSIVACFITACGPESDDDGDDPMEGTGGAVECQLEASRRCHEGNPHFVDSCGTVGEQIETCEGGRACEEGLCRCTERFGGPLACHEGDVWRMDPCGDPDYLAQRCTEDENCMNGGCVAMMCVPRDELCNGEDDDCDGTTDEGDLCPGGVPCEGGRCAEGGVLCNPCQADGDCRDGYTCAGYSSFPELGQVCVPTGCNDGVTCPEGTNCSDNGLCWLTWSEACHADGNTWNFDTCGRPVRIEEECDPERPCADGRCTGEGGLCDECDGDGGCGPNYRCRGYGSFPDVPQVCVPESDCATNANSRCPDGFQCGSTGVCWLTWETTCSEENVWNRDTCGRMVQEATDCPDQSPCQEGRCVGEGTLCTGCETEADCALGYLCRGYQNYPDVPLVCVPESNCANDPDDACPAGLRCGSNTVCWMSLAPICQADGVDVWDYDTCGRYVRMGEECGAERHCEPISGEPGSASDEGCAAAAAILVACWGEIFDEATFIANCEGEGSAADVDCITGLTCEDAPVAVDLCLWSDRPRGVCADGPPAVCDIALEGVLGEQSGALEGINILTGSCVDAIGPEQVIQFTAGAAGDYQFDTAGSAFDTVLYVRGVCNDTETELGCNDDAEGALSSRVEVALAADQEVYAIIDGHGRAGAWTLTITGPEPDGPVEMPDEPPEEPPEEDPENGAGGGG